MIRARAMGMLTARIATMLIDRVRDRVIQTANTTNMTCVNG